MKVLRILRCSDPMYWYRNLVGQCVVYVKEDAMHFWSREPAGYINTISKCDAIVEVQNIMDPE